MRGAKCSRANRGTLIVVSKDDLHGKEEYISDALVQSLLLTIKIWLSQAWYYPQKRQCNNVLVSVLNIKLIVYMIRFKK